MKTTKPMLLGAGLLACALAFPAVAGMWSNWPTVGRGAHCASESTSGVPGTPAVCTTTVPAGPSIVTGAETIPADTNLASGRVPQQVNIGMASLNALPVSVSASSAADATTTKTATATTGGFIVVGSAALSPHTVVLPPNPIDGQQFVLSSNQTIATLTINAAASPAGQSIANAPTVLTVSTTGAFGYQFRYSTANNTWYRLQ